MIEKITAIAAAGACASLVVTFVTGFAPGAAVGATEVAGANARASDQVTTVAERAKPTAAEIQKAIEQNLRNGSRNPKIICAKSWPNYDQSCLYSAQRADSDASRVVRVIATDQAHAARTTQARR